MANDHDKESIKKSTLFIYKKHLAEKVFYNKI